MATEPVNVVGSTPISFTGTAGGQRSVPLSALQFNGSTIEVAHDWTAQFDGAETTTLLAVANARVALGELTPPPAPPPLPALVFTAAHTGPETNGIVVTTKADSGPPLSRAITVTAAETDKYPTLATAEAAAQAIGVDAPTGSPTDPPAGTGLVVLKQSSVAAGTELPTDAQTGVLKEAGFDVKATDGSVLFTLLPRADYKGSDGLSISVDVDPSGLSFTVTAVYDSTKEAGQQDPITIQTLDKLPEQVAYLVTAKAPSSGALIPVDGSVTLSGGRLGLSASAICYTS